MAPRRTLLFSIVVGCVCMLLILQLPTPWVLRAPGATVDIGSRIDGPRPATRGPRILFAGSIVRRATVLDALYARVSSQASLMRGEDATRLLKRGSPALDEVHLKDAQILAQAACYDVLDRKLNVRPAGVRVVDFVPPTEAVGLLRQCDVILAVDRKAVRTFPDLQSAVTSNVVGAPVRLWVERDGQPREVDVRTVGIGGRTVIGVRVEPVLAEDPQQPSPRLRPTRGLDATVALPLALELLRRHGYPLGGTVVAAWGEVSESGSISATGEGPLRFDAAVRGGATVVVAPGMDAMEITQVPPGVRLLPVHMLQDACRALQNLP